MGWSGRPEAYGWNKRSDEGLVALFDELPDPRVERGHLHDLGELLHRLIIGPGSLATRRNPCGLSR